jgi:hypothetical protein
MLSPATPSSSSLRNISTPVTTFFFVGPNPMISISSPTFTLPRSTLPVTTVPRPEIEKTSSIGIRNGLSTFALRHRDVAVERVHQRENPSAPPGSPLSALSADRRITGQIVARESVRLQQLAHFELDEVEQIGIVDRVNLVERDDHVRHVDLLARAARARGVCGIGPSVADTTRWRRPSARRR